MHASVMGLALAPMDSALVYLDLQTTVCGRHTRLMKVSTHTTASAPHADASMDDAQRLFVLANLDNLGTCRTH